MFTFLVSEEDDDDAEDGVPLDSVYKDLEVILWKYQRFQLPW